jgi:hypothetical protein
MGISHLLDTSLLIVDNYYVYQTKSIPLIHLIYQRQSQYMCRKENYTQRKIQDNKGDTI